MFLKKQKNKQNKKNKSMKRNVDVPYIFMEPVKEPLPCLQALRVIINTTNSSLRLPDEVQRDWLNICKY